MTDQKTLDSQPASLLNTWLGGTLWEYGEDNDGWYAGPPGEQICFACTQDDAMRVAACVNACMDIPTDMLNTFGVTPKV